MTLNSQSISFAHLGAPPAASSSTSYPNLNQNNNSSNTGYCSADLGSKIFLSMCPLLLGFGTCTNIFSLLVLSRKRMRKHSTYVYLAILSVIDLLALWLGLVRDYLSHGYGINIQSTWLCKLHSFLFYYTLDLSSWILVAVSIDRFLAITFVFSSYTRQLLLKLLAKPKLICCVICFCLLLLNFHFVIYVEANAQSRSNTGTGPAAAPLKSSYQPGKKSTAVGLDADLAGQNIFSDFPINDLIRENKSPSMQPLASMSEKSAFALPDQANKEEKLVVRNYHSIGVSNEYLNCIIDVNKHPAYIKFFVNIWPYIDLSAYAILPFVIMFVCNTLE